MSHTPGPWKVDPKREMRICTVSDVTVCTTGCDDGQRDSWGANARLIAAAPQLLAALRECAEAIERQCKTLAFPEENCPYLAAARAAIAKAEGK